MLEFLPLLFLLLATGLFAGFIGGLFGIGGGIVIVPALYTVFGYVGVPEELRIKIAVGTSLATIIVTSYRSIKAHQKHGAVDMTLLKAWSPFIAGGAIVGAVLARVLEADTLTIIFAIGALLVALKKGLGKDKKHEGDDLAPVPGGAIKAGLGSSVGVISALMGIGGGVMGVIILTSFGRTIHQAIATAAGFGMAIALPGTIGFMVAGWGSVGVPVGTIGYVSLPAFAIIALMTSLTAPFGANVAHKLDQKLLNRVFSIYLAITAIMMFRDVLA